MTTYHEFKVNLSDGQKAKLAKAMRDSSPLTLRLSRDELNGNDELMLTKTQIGKLRKAMQKGTGAELKISKAQIRKAVKHEGSLWSSLISLGAKVLPFVTKGVSKVAPHLATGALSALGSLGIDKIFGSGGVHGGMVNPIGVIMKMIEKGIEVPSEFLSKLASLGNFLTKGQRNFVGRGIQSESGIVLKPTQRQIQGGFLGTLAAIGIPMAIELASKLFGKGLSAPRRAGRGLQVSPKPWQYLQNPPPFLGTWEQQGMGRKKKLTWERGFCWEQPVPSKTFRCWGRSFEADRRDASEAATFQRCFSCQILICLIG